ncbi:MAG: PIN domain-containing protein [Gammaproteobacteria bacterium]|nr:PIN domain-containing protein [Gammaproteobacteria bacterium]
MSVAYVDSSALAAIAFDEPRASKLASRMDGFDRLISSNLLEAELRAAFMRERLEFQESIVLGIDWILPDRTLAPEFKTVLRAGYLRGANLWHLATALYVSSGRPRLSFATLDARQAGVADALGFAVLGEP